MLAARGSYQYKSYYYYVVYYVIIFDDTAKWEVVLPNNRFR